MARQPEPASPEFEHSAADQRRADARAGGLFRSARARRSGGRSRARSRRRGRWGSTPSNGPPTADADDVLGRLGGVFCGRVMEYLPGRELFVADAWWLPPDGDPIGPMALEVSCRMAGPACRLQVKQTGFEDTPRWRRYYAVIASGWRSSLVALKEYVENRRRDEPFIKALGLRDVVLMNIVAVVGMRWIARGARTGPASVTAVGAGVDRVLRPARARGVGAGAQVSRTGRRLRLGAPRVRAGPRVHLRLVPLGQQPVLLPVRPAVRRGELRGDGRRGWEALGASRWYSVAFVLSGIWVAAGINIIGLRLGKVAAERRQPRRVDSGRPVDRLRRARADALRFGHVVHRGHDGAARARCSRRSRCGRRCVSRSPASRSRRSSARRSRIPSAPFRAASSSRAR